MDTHDKIREALERIANRLSPNSLPVDGMMEGPEGHFVRQEADKSFDDARAALASLSQPSAGTAGVDRIVEEVEVWLMTHGTGTFPPAWYDDLTARLSALAPTQQPDRLTNDNIETIASFIAGQLDRDGHHNRYDAAKKALTLYRDHIRDNSPLPSAPTQDR